MTSLTACPASAPAARMLNKPFTRNSLTTKPTSAATARTCPRFGIGCGAQLRRNALKTCQIRRPFYIGARKHEESWRALTFEFPPDKLLRELTRTTGVPDRDR